MHYLLSVSGLCEVRLALAETQLEHEGRIRARHGARAAQRLQKDGEVLLPLSLLVRLPQELHHRAPRLLVLAQVAPRAHDTHLGHK